MDIFQQQELLRNLPDNKLQMEAQQPTGAVPPYMVLGEMQRRQTMRTNYLGQKAIYDSKNHTTVAQDLLAGHQNPGPPATPNTGSGLSAAAGAPPSPTAPGGLTAAASPPPPPVTQTGNGFAGGGLVDATLPPTTDPNADPYTELLQQLAEERKKSASLALLQAGLGILGGGSSNTAQNLAGAAPAIAAYQSGLGNMDRSQADILSLQQQRRNQQEQNALEKDRTAEEAMPAWQKSFNAYQTLSPDDQQAAQDLASSPIGTATAGTASTVASQRQRANAIKAEVNNMTKAIGQMGDLSALAPYGVVVTPDLEAAYRNPATKAAAAVQIQQLILKAAQDRVDRYGYPGSPATDGSSAIDDAGTDTGSPAAPGPGAANPADPLGLGL